MDVTSLAGLLSNVRFDDGTVHFVVADAPRTPYYVQATTDGTSFQVEAAGPANMPMSYRENPRRDAELERLGWPSAPDPATGNYTLVIPDRDWDPARVARLIRDTFVKGYGMDARSVTTTSATWAPPTSHDISEEAFVAVRRLDPASRYEYLIKHAADQGVVFMLRQGIDWVAFEGGGASSVGVWPHRRLAAAEAADDDAVIEVPIDEFATVLGGLPGDWSIAAFPVGGQPHGIVAPKTMLDDLSIEADRLR